MRLEDTYLKDVSKLFAAANAVVQNGNRADPLTGLPWLGHGNNQPAIVWKTGTSKLVTKVEIMPSYFNGTW